MGTTGTGKTTLARIVAEMTRAHFVQFSAVLSGIKEIKDVMAAAEVRRRNTGRRTIVFIDEIHASTRPSRMRSSPGSRPATSC